MYDEYEDDPITLYDVGIAAHIARTSRGLSRRITLARRDHFIRRYCGSDLSAASSISSRCLRFSL